MIPLTKAEQCPNSGYAGHEESIHRAATTLADVDTPAEVSDEAAAAGEITNNAYPLARKRCHQTATNTSK